MYKNNEINPFSSTSCIKGQYLDNSICKKCSEECSNYQENTCICYSKYSFDGNYYKTNKSLSLLKTDNLTDIEDRIFEIIKNKLNNGAINLTYLDSGNYFYAEVSETKFIIYKTEDTEKMI